MCSNEYIFKKQQWFKYTQIKDNRIPSLDGDGLEMSLDALLPPRQIQNPVAGLFPDFRPIWPPELNMVYEYTVSDQEPIFLNNAFLDCSFSLQHIDYS